MKKQILVVAIVLFSVMGCGNGGESGSEVNQNASFYANYVAFDSSLGEPGDDFDSRWFNKLLAPDVKTVFIQFDKTEWNRKRYLYETKESYYFFINYPLTNLKLAEIPPGHYRVYRSLLDQDNNILFGGGEPLEFDFVSDQVEFIDEVIEFPLYHRFNKTDLFIKNFGDEPVTNVYTIDEHDPATSSFNTDLELGIFPESEVVQCPDDAASRCLKLKYRFAYSNAETREPVKNKTIIWQDGNGINHEMSLSLTFKYIAEMMAARLPIVIEY